MANVDPNAPNTKLSTPSLSNSGNTYSYPSDITTQQYYTTLQFQKYSRPYPANPQSVSSPSGTIILPVPMGLAERVGLNWGEGTLSSLTGETLDEAKKFITAQYQKGVDAAFSDAGQSIKGAFSSVGQSLETLAIAKQMIAPSSGSDGNVLGNAAATLAGVVLNPHLTTIFGGVKLRVFRLSWKLSPRTQQEAQTINTIVRMLRNRSLPSYAAGTKFALAYPNQVVVSFQNIKIMDSIKRSVVADVQAEYTGQTGANFYVGGYPVEVDLTLDLMETEIRTAEDYQ